MHPLPDYVISGNTVEATASVISSDTGSVTFEMQVYDHAGNSITLTQSDLTSSNVLVDNTSPAKQQLEISSSNSNATLAKSGDTINVTLTASEPIQSAFIVSPDFASVAFELLEDISNCCFAGDVLSTRTFDEVRSDCVSVMELPDIATVAVRANTGMHFV